MHNDKFENDYLSRKVTQILLLLQIAGMVFVFILIAFRFYSLALFTSFVSFLFFASIVLWLYLRYKNIPVVKEKFNLQQTAPILHENIRKEINNIETVKKKRDRLFQDEKEENSSTLLNLQQDYIKNGLLTNYIEDAVISGVGSKLKERLATYRIFTAADISNRISEIPGFGEAKQQALVSWKESIYAQFDKTKPTQLSNEQIENIQRKYQSLQEQNNSYEKNALDNRQKLENDLRSLKSRLKQLASITFTAYLGKSLDSQGYIAVIIAFVLIATQAISGVSATVSAIIASIPTATTVPTFTFTPTITNTPTFTFTPTITNTPTFTFTPTITNTPTLTFTPLSTQTYLPIYAPSQSYPANVTAICWDGTYSYSQHRRGTCSHHGGVKIWVNRPPN